jgi:hypothetical protein
VQAVPLLLVSVRVPYRCPAPASGVLRPAVSAAVWQRSNAPVVVAAGSPAGWVDGAVEGAAVGVPAVGVAADGDPAAGGLGSAGPLLRAATGAGPVGASASRTDPVKEQAGVASAVTTRRARISSLRVVLMTTG